MNNTNIARKILIRRARPNDALSIIHVLHQTWLSTYPNEEMGITKEKIEESFQESLSKENVKKFASKIALKIPDEMRLVALVDGKIIGIATLIKNKQNNELKTIYVLPEFQGKGVGKMLWEEVRKFCDISKETIVNVATFNLNAIEFYKKLGFVDTGKRIEKGNWRVKTSSFKMPTMEMAIKV